MKYLAFYIVIGTLLTTSCSLDRDLDIQDIDTKAQYFIECYLQPDSLLNLSATEVSPIFEEFILDYSLDFDVFIIDQDTVELLQSLFIEEETGYIYNFGSGRRLSSQAIEVSLLVITPTDDTIRATTKVPQPIEILASEWQTSEVSVRFKSSSDANQNFYLLILNYSVETDGSKIDKNELQYLDYSYLIEEVTLDEKISSDSLLYSSEVELTLMRVTRENFEYQKSLNSAQNASKDNVTFPSPLEGNINGGLGIFTCYRQDVQVLSANDNP